MDERLGRGFGEEKSRPTNGDGGAGGTQLRTDSVKVSIASSKHEGWLREGREVSRASSDWDVASGNSRLEAERSSDAELEQAGEDKEHDAGRNSRIEPVYDGEEVGAVGRLGQLVDDGGNGVVPDVEVEHAEQRDEAGRLHVGEVEWSMGGKERREADAGFYRRRSR